MAAPAARPQSYGVKASPWVASQPWFKSSQLIMGRDWPTAYLFILPTALLLFGLIGYPFYRTIWLSFTGDE